LTADQFSTQTELSEKEKDRILKCKKNLVKFYNQFMIKDEDNDEYVKVDKKVEEDEEDEDY
jgi:hypothetical protein